MSYELRSDSIIGAGEANPSLGMIGGVEFDRENQRIKGTLLPPVYNLDQLKELYQSQVDGLIAELPASGRVITRLLIGENIDYHELLAFSYNHHGLVVGVEGYIPLPDNSLGLQGIVYLGGNSASRMPSVEIIRSERDILDRARKSAEERMPEVLPEGYQVQLVPANSLAGLADQDIEVLVELYKRTYKSYTCPFTFNGIRNNAFSSVVGLVRNSKGRIVSVTMGEITPPIAGAIRMCEISDSASDIWLKVKPVAGLTAGEFIEGNPDVYDPELRNANFWAKKAVVEYLVEKGIEVIFTESRLNWGAVMRSNFWLGLEPVGWLPRHCQISSSLESVHDSSDQGFGNLVVMALLPEQRQTYQRREK